MIRGKIIVEKIKKVIEKILTKEVILYIVFGLLTTIINLGSFYVFNNIWQWNENLSNLIAIILAVLVAYITNKDLVFHSEAKTLKEKLQEFFKFMLGRAFTMIVEFLGGFLLFQTPIPEMVSKAFITVLVIILNFFISKFFAFNHKGTNNREA